MLCCDLVFNILGCSSYTLNASQDADIYTVNICNSFHLSIKIDNYKVSGQLKIPACHSGIVEPKLKLIDMLNRELCVRVSIQAFHGKGMEICVSAPVWIINKTALPLVYRQEGSSQCTASGQYEEHEKARVVSPLMLSFSDQEGSPSLEIRLGNRLGNNNPWCEGFGFHKEISYRKLNADGTSYDIGIHVRRGRGLYSSTIYVYLAPRFQLCNKTIYNLEFAQKCDIVQNESEESSTSKIFTAPPGCIFPFHWPNAHQDLLLCTRIANIEFCQWSSAIPLNEDQSLFMNVRHKLGEMVFLRIEIISKDATYFILFTDAYTLPPPIRIDNYSEVLLHFSQYNCRPNWRTPVRPQSSVAYALDDPFGNQCLEIEAPGGNFIEFPLNIFKNSRNVTYPNYFYIAFKRTFNTHLFDNCSESTIDVQQLVLGVKDKRVVITSKCTGDRSQLWLMNSHGQLEHEGSSPPIDSTRSNETKVRRLVLDLEKAPNPVEYINLVIRPSNQQRRATQTWRFENGRLKCHANMCVQTRNGIYGLRPGYEAVLGRVEPQSKLNTNIVPIEQCIEKQNLLSGSGLLQVINKMNGPIQTIQIHDVRTKQQEVILNSDFSWNHISTNTVKLDKKDQRSICDKCSLTFEVPKGVGISLITSQPCEELAYISLENIVLNAYFTSLCKSFNFKVRHIQIDNQLLDSSCPVLLHTAESKNKDCMKDGLFITGKILQSPKKHAVIFEHLSVDIKPCIIFLEERHFLKTILFFGYGKVLSDATTIGYTEESHFIERNILPKTSKRYYFGNFIIGSSQIKISVLTAQKLTQELLQTKKAIGLTLIQFEDAVIEFDKFFEKNHFETMEVYLRAIKLHYINQVKWRAASVLCSVDFLGNPLGFANDLTEGVSSLIFEGSVKNLVKNVAHGMSNTTVKLTETLSDNLGKIFLDDHDNETRHRILEVSPNSNGGHLSAGLKGLGFGLLGGVTSVVRHSYVGIQSDGFPGLLNGLGKGIVGTFMKPIIGILDLTSETASVVRESSKGSHHSTPDRKRLPRCVLGAPGGLLPLYSHRQSKGQQYLYKINNRNLNEKLLSYEPHLCNDSDAKLRLLVSTEYVRVFSRCDEEPTIMFECHLNEVLSCHPLITNKSSSNSATKTAPSYYIEISTISPKITRPRFRCKNEDIAEKAARCINYAKSVFDEHEQSVGGTE